MDDEIWKVLPFAGEKYEVSNHGRVKTHYRCEEGRLMALHKDRLGYVKVRMRNNGKQKQYCVHRLVGLMFVPNPFMYNEINHIDGNKQNNYYENLEWCTHQQNMRHAFDTGLDYVPKGALHPSAKSFYQFDLDGNLIKHWHCVTECAQYLFEHDEKAKSEFSNFHSLRVNIGHALNGAHKTCCGYLFGFDPIAPKLEYNNRRTPLIATDKKTGEQYEFSGIQDTEGYTMPNGKVTIATIVCKCCKGKRKSHAGYYWRYKNI